MEQKFVLGTKVKVIITGTITEAYFGYEVDKGDVIKYKVTAPEGTVIGLTEENMQKIENIVE